MVCRIYCYLSYLSCSRVNHVPSLPPFGLHACLWLQVTVVLWRHRRRRHPPAPAPRPHPPPGPRTPLGMLLTARRWMVALWRCRLQCCCTHGQVGFNGVMYPGLGVFLQCSTGRAGWWSHAPCVPRHVHSFCRTSYPHAVGYTPSTPLPPGRQYAPYSHRDNRGLYCMLRFPLCIGFCHALILHLYCHRWLFTMPLHEMYECVRWGLASLRVSGCLVLH